jgi:hypothetical protein
LLIDAPLDPAPNTRATRPVSSPIRPPRCDPHHHDAPAARRTAPTADERIRPRLLRL